MDRRIARPETPNRSETTPEGLICASLSGRAVQSGADLEVVWWELTGRRGPRPRRAVPAPAAPPEPLRLRLRDHRDQLIRRIRLGQVIDSHG